MGCSSSVAVAPRVPSELLSDETVEHCMALPNFSDDLNDLRMLNASDFARATQVAKSIKLKLDQCLEQSAAPIKFTQKMKITYRECQQHTSMIMHDAMIATYLPSESAECVQKIHREREELITILDAFTKLVGMILHENRVRNMTRRSATSNIQRGAGKSVPHVYVRTDKKQKGRIIYRRGKSQYVRRTAKSGGLEYIRLTSA